MPEFGTSAFLKLVHLNPRPQRTAVRDRLSPSDSGYDFHRRLRLDTRRFLVDGTALDELLEASASIVKEAERKAVVAGLTSISEWRTRYGGKISSFSSSTFASPNQHFTVKFTPDFCFDKNGRQIAVHVWNTAKPALESRMVRGVLSLFHDHYANSDEPATLAVMCLRTRKLIHLQDVETYKPLGEAIVTRIDNIFAQLRRELGEPKGGEDRPSAPSPRA